MKSIVIFPDYADNVFFKNELPYINSFFDEVYIISYHYNNSAHFNSNDHVFEIKIKYGNVFSLGFIKWFFGSDVRQEIRDHISFSFMGLKRLARVIKYGVFLKEAKKIIKNRNIPLTSSTVIYSFWLTEGAYATAYLGDHFGLKTISRAHGFDLYEERNARNYIPFRRAIATKMSDIYFISKDGKDYFEKKYSKYGIKSRLKISHLGTVDRGVLAYHDNGNKIIFASCSSVISIKRIDLIIRELSKLSFPFIWYHIGDGYLMKEIKIMAESYLPHGSYFLMGKIDNNKIVDFYKEHYVDYFINMSDHEGVPVSIMEAMSAGIPVIARDVGGTREIVNSSTGYLIKEKEDDEVV